MHKSTYRTWPKGIYYFIITRRKQLLTKPKLTVEQCFARLQRGISHATILGITNKALDAFAVTRYTSMQ